MSRRELFTLDFWADTAERAVKTAAQFFLTAAALGDPGVSLFGLDWMAALGLAGAGALASLLTSVISAKVTNTDSASIIE